MCLSGRFCVSLRLSYIGFLFIFNFLLSLCLLKFSQVYFFSADPETLTNHLVPTGSFSPQELYIHFLG